jgi:hypothetical protein
MDTQLSGSSLRQHGEHLRKLSTELTATLTKLEQALAEPQRPSETHAVNLLEGTAALNNSLFVAAVFCQRLQLFLERTERDKGSSWQN